MNLDLIFLNIDSHTSFIPHSWYCFNFIVKLFLHYSLLNFYIPKHVIVEGVRLFIC